MPRIRLRHAELPKSLAGWVTVNDLGLPRLWVNQALAISPIYSEVAKVARTRTIDKLALLRLPPDKQIGGVPHGIPIAGIGGCSVGQSLCVKNPVLNCYTCRKFMPVGDAAIHRHVAEELRPVGLEFARASGATLKRLPIPNSVAC